MNGSIFTRWSSVFILILSISYIGYIPTQSDFLNIIIPYCFAFGSYIWILKKEQNSFKLFLILAILIRAILIFSFPNLSNDIYRFIWDGNFSVSGINPYTILPVEYIENPSLNFNNESLFGLLNSPEYYTIYPSVAQLIYGFCAYLSDGNIQFFSVMLKSILFLFEIGLIYFMYALLLLWKIPRNRLFIYALNPLIIIEIMGNVHFEGVMIFFLAWFIWLLQKNKIWSAAFTLALSVCSKLLPLMFMPLLFRKFGIKRFIAFSVVTFGLITLFMIPVWSGIAIHNLFESIDLYFQKFEFNASLYYIFRWIGYQFIGYNMIGTIGPLLGLGLLTFVCFLSLKQESSFDTIQFVKLSLLVFSVYLFTATTIHPWYLSLPIFLCVFTRFRFPILWSGLIMMTYINYSYTAYFENLWIVGIEYTLVISYVIYEIFGHKKSALS